MLYSHGPETIRVAGEVHQRAAIHEDRMGHAPGVRRDPFQVAAGGLDAPDVELIGAPFAHTSHLG
jgi:hypothetical protein